MRGEVPCFFLARILADIAVLSPVVEDVEAGAAIAPIIRPVHRYTRDLGAEAARDHVAVSLLG
jgi:hypothetical protein